MVVYLLNVQEWSFLSDLDIRGAKETMDYKEVVYGERENDLEGYNCPNN